MGFIQESSGESVEKRLDCGCGVNVELRGLPDGLDLGLEGK